MNPSAPTAVCRACGTAFATHGAASGRLCPLCLLEPTLAYLESLENVPFAYDYGFLSTHPDSDLFRGEPRFQALLQAIRKPVRNGHVQGIPPQ